ncbi:MAG: 3',5'-cyclic-AMP phosphodiesterase [Pseudohongiellaceae bacterium]|nr:3',5'-cyclic-AMP phosphodiesterase [Pseudohongiellaceae bacterium]
MNIKRANKALRLLQITDSHLFKDPSAALLNLNTQESFEKVLELVQEKEASFDLVLASGDISQDASQESYLRFGQAMDELGAPFVWIPGNHDRRHAMAEVPGYSEASTPLLRSGNWQIVMLDSSVIGEVHGMLHDKDLQHLRASLEQAEQDPSIEHSLVCLHHNPVPGTAGWMDGIGLHNSDEFLSLIKGSSTVKAVVYGHIHQELDFDYEGVRFFCTPSTCIQFKPDVEDFTLDTVNPAYRWFELDDDGSIRSAVERVQGFHFDVDHSSTGY